MAGTYGDLVVNGSFTNGTTDWWSGDPTKITLTAVAGGAVAAATTDAVNRYDAPFGQDNIHLRTGVLYTLTFTARASQPGTLLRAAVGLGVPPYTAAKELTVELGLVDRHFVTQFTSSMTNVAAQLSFQIGQETEVSVTLTEVRLTTSTVREGLYVDPNNNAQEWADANPGDGRTPAIRKSIARRAGAAWFGDWIPNIQTAVDAYVTAAANVGKLPILTAYNIYWRDNGGESSGGSPTAAAYETWISAFAAGIGNRPAIVILEPDSLAQAEYLPPAARTTRYALISYAANALAARPLCRTYLDGANATWIRPGDMAARLVQANIAAVKGFAVGVANFHASDISCAYGNQIVAALAAQGVAGGRFVIDTARNGNGSMDAFGVHVNFCNPAGRRLGVPSSIGVGGAEYLLWVKFPGDSDGQCGTAPDTPAGTFSPFLAMNLINGT